MSGDADQRAGEQPAEKQGKPNSNGSADNNQPGSLRDNQPQQTIARGAKSEANAHLLRAPTHRISEDSKDADRSENHGQQGEASDERQHQLSWPQEIGEPFIHDFDAEQRLLAIDGGDRIAHGI